MSTDPSNPVPTIEPLHPITPRPIRILILVPFPSSIFPSAQSLSGPWTSQADIAPQAVRTYFSQNAYDLPLGSNAIYMGDRWRPSLLGSSRYIWYPLDWSSGSPTLVHADVWTVNLQAGAYHFHFLLTPQSLFDRDLSHHPTETLDFELPRVISLTCHMGRLFLILIGFFFFFSW